MVSSRKPSRTLTLVLLRWVATAEAAAVAEDMVAVVATEVDVVVAVEAATLAATTHHLVAADGKKSRHLMEVIFAFLRHDTI